MADEALHLSHPEVVQRLKWAEGHMRSVVGMIEAGRPYLELAQQLHAVEKAVANAKRLLSRDHTDHCLEHAAGGAPAEARRAIEEFKEATKYL